MSRIDEALRKTQGTGDVPSPAGQVAFQPAWSLAHRESDPRETTESAPALPVHGPMLTSPPQGMVSLTTSWRQRLALAPDGDPILIEQFRRLAGVLHQNRGTNGLKSVMVTSAVAGDGKTLTAVNLALVLAESFRAKVLLVDADLRRPSIPSVLGLGEGVGLSEALRSPTEQKLALVAVTPRLTLLPAGRPVMNSIEALTAPRMRQILAEASSRFDWVILDAPPVGPAADAGLLTDLVGGTLFVVHAGHTQCPDAQRAIDALGRDRILGIVLNGMKNVSTQVYYGPSS